MTPVERAAAVYEREPCARSFREDLEAHLLGGWVFSTPTAFVMGRAVRRDADQRLIVDPWHRFDAQTADCWLVYLAAGLVKECLTFLPYPLHWFAWERGNRLRFYHFNRLTRHDPSASLLGRAPSAARGIAPPDVRFCGRMARPGPQA